MAPYRTIKLNSDLVCVVSYFSRHFSHKINTFKSNKISSAEKKNQKTNERHNEEKLKERNA